MSGVVSYGTSHVLSYWSRHIVSFENRYGAWYGDGHFVLFWDRHVVSYDDRYSRHPPRVRRRLRKIWRHFCVGMKGYICGVAVDFE